jgi:hypothetical protein
MEELDRKAIVYSEKSQHYVGVLVGPVKMCVGIQAA